MQIIKSNGRVIGMGEPWYVAVGKNGCWQRVKSRGEAIALSVNGTLYSIDAKHPATIKVYDEDGSERTQNAPLAVVEEAEDGEVSFALHTTTEAHGERIEELSDGVMELSDMQTLGSAELSAGLMELSDVQTEGSAETNNAVMELSDMLAEALERITTLEELIAE